MAKDSESLPAGDRVAERSLVASEMPSQAEHWGDTAARFLTAVAAEQRETVEPLLAHRGDTPVGLRRWLEAIALRATAMPERIPMALIDVYLRDPEAAPLYQCEECGLAVPVRPNRALGPDAEPEQVYFPRCPVCGGQTGYCLYRDGDSAVRLSREKPR